MSQFDIFKNNGRLKEDIPYVLDVQSNLISSVLSTTVVVPLLKYRLISKMALKIHIVIQIKGKKFVALFDELASVPKSVLGDNVTNIGNTHGAACKTALDVLFFNQP